MTGEQLFLFGLLGLMFAMLVWGRVRYDLVGFATLIIAVVGGAVDPHDAFKGFGHEAVIIIALVLVASRALINSGAVELLAGYVVSAERTLPTHISVMAVAGAALSAVINNVAALVILMTLDMEAAQKAKRAISLSLMPLSFATILGGMITMIGTPPNIVIAQYRTGVAGEPFAMFDFAPVGLICAAIGIAFVATIGWRLIPHRGPASVGTSEDDPRFLAEAKVTDKSTSIGKTPRELYDLAEEHDILIAGLVRRGKRLRGFAAGEEIRKGDFLVLEGHAKAIETFSGAAKLQFAGAEKHGGMTGKSLKMVEVVVTDSSRISGRTAWDLRLLYRRGVTLLGISREGRRISDRVRKTTVKTGDVLLLMGTETRVADTIEWLSVLPIADRHHPVIQRSKAFMAIGLFAAAIGLSVLGLVDLPIALAGAVGIYAMLNIIGPKEVYESVEWPVIVLLASLIPLGAALEESGGTKLIADGIVSVSGGLPSWAILTIIIIVTMTLSDFLNNVATALIAAPVAVDVAGALDVSSDPFLMGVAVAASCAFLTPIGHKNNTIILGPGNYHFGDYWRMGLPLEIIIIVVSVPSILFFWPL
ncbi:MAG: SLC13 family permease [Rhizobiaceae bacterium]